MQKTNIKDAFWLTRFEMRHSLLSYAILVIIFLFLFILSPSFILAEKDEIGMGMDYNFLFILIALPALIKKLPFRAVSMGDYKYASPFYVLTKQLAIDRSAYILYLFVYRFIFSFVVTIIYLVILYSVWGNQVSFYAYMSFILLWTVLTFTTQLLDAYTHFSYHIIPWISAIFILVPILFMINMLIFHVHFYEYGFVYWTLDVAEKHPLYLTASALLLMIGNIFFWTNMFRRKMNRTDLYY